MAFRIPTRVTMEPGALGRLGTTARGLGATRATVVIDPGLRETRWPQRSVAGLLAEGLEVSLFDGVEANPRSGTIETLAEKLRAEGTDLVVGLGGGSVLDAAKAAAMLARNEGSCEDFEGKDRFANPPLPFVAVPTTCGTGSEVTWVSVITVDAKQTKISVKGDGMFPDAALVDPDLLASLPPSLVAATGMDALTHALEAVTGTEANPASDALAARAVGLLLGYLERAVAGIGDDAEARERVMYASTLAGMAFGNSDVGAVHCLSETLGGLYDCPHGVTNAMLLVPVLRSHGSSVHGPLATIERTLRGRYLEAPPAELADGLLKRIESLARAVGLPRFAALNVPTGDYEKIAERAMANGSNDSNPRPMGADEYLQILREL